MEVKLENPKLYSQFWIHMHSTTHLHFKSKFIMAWVLALASAQTISPNMRHYIASCLNIIFEVNKDSTMTEKAKKENLSNRSVVILCDHLDYLFVFNI